jgi:hypothetical protein
MKEIELLIFKTLILNYSIEAEGVRPPAGLAGQVRPRRRSRGGSPPAPRSRTPAVEIKHTIVHW